MKRIAAQSGIFLLVVALLPALAQIKTQPAAPNPLSLPDTIAYLSVGVQPGSLEPLVQRGLDFALTDPVAAGLKKCGAQDETLQAMRLKQSTAQKIWLPAYDVLCSAIEKGDYQGAVQTLNGLPEKPGIGATFYFMARVVLDNDDPENAVAVAQKAVSLEPDVAENHTLLALVLLDEGANDQALAEAQAIVTKFPNLGEGHRVLGMVLKAKGDSAGAVREMKEAVRLAPYSHKAKATLGDAVETSDDVEGADKAYRDDIDANPKSFNAHYNYGIFLSHAKNDLIGAMAQYQEALAINPTDGRALNNMGAVSCEAGHHEEAVKAYGKLFELYPDWDMGRECYAKSLYYTNNLVESVKQAQLGARENPGSMVFERYLGLSYLQLGNVAEGTELLLKVLAKEPQRASAHLEAARALRMSHREAEAIKQYREAQRLDPQDFAAIVELGGILSSSGKEAEALAQYEKAIPLMNDEKYTAWVNGLRQSLEEKHLPVATASSDKDAAPLPPSPDGDFVHSHSNGDIQRLVDRVMAASLSELENWKRDPALMGKTYSVLCTPYDKSLAEDMVRGAAMRYQDRVTPAGIAEVTWATAQLMMARKTERVHLVALINKSEEFAKAEPPTIPGVASVLSDVAISFQKHMLDAPVQGKLPLPLNYVGCHLQTHPAPEFARGQEVGLTSGRIQVAATIGRDGSVTEAKAITQASDVLTKIAIDTVKRYKYDPIYLAGQPWEVDTIVDVSFK